MSRFFQQSAYALISQYPEDFPLLKIQYVLDWQAIEHILHNKKARYIRDNGGRPSYPLLSMFKAVLLGQWHSLSDPELERSLVTRLDFFLFCNFDELNIPDYSTLNRFRNWLMQDNTLDELIELINQQLAQKQLKVKKAKAAIVDATIVQTAGGKLKKAVETTENKVVDVDDVDAGVTVFADKGYDSQKNRDILEDRGLKDGIMRKAHRGKPLNEENKIRNKGLSKIRYRVEQSFILHRKFRCKRASYFGLAKVKGQMQLKVICLNLLKAANKLRLVTPIAA